MAYDTSKLIRLSALEALAQKVKSDYAALTVTNALDTRISAIEALNPEENVIETVKVNGTALTPDSNKAVDIAVPAYSLTKDATSSDYAAVYHLTKDGTNEGVSINIPKDMVVKSGTVVTNPEGQAAGTYIELVLANATDDKIYIPVDGLIEYVTSGSVAGDMVFVTISDDHKVTATITDGTITKAKLAATIQAQLDKVDELADGATKVEASTTNGNIIIDGVETTVYTHPTHTAYAAGFYKVTVDALGHVTAATAVAKADLDALIGNASATANGLMTSAQFTKLADITEGATKVEASDTNGNIKIDGTETTVYDDSDVLKDSDIASDAEVTEMLTTTFGA